MPLFGATRPTQIHRSAGAVAGATSGAGRGGAGGRRDGGRRDHGGARVAGAAQLGLVERGHRDGEAGPAGQIRPLVQRTELVPGHRVVPRGVVLRGASRCGSSRRASRAARPTTRPWPRRWRTGRGGRRPAGRHRRSAGTASCPLRSRGRSSPRRCATRSHGTPRRPAAAACAGPPRRRGAAWGRTDGWRSSPLRRALVPQLTEQVDEAIGRVRANRARPAAADRPRQAGPVRSGPPARRRWLRRASYGSRGRDEDARAAQDLGDRTPVERHHREAGRHGLDDGDAEAFVFAR